MRQRHEQWSERCERRVGRHHYHHPARANNHLRARHHRSTARLVARAKSFTHRTANSAARFVAIGATTDSYRFLFATRFFPKSRIGRTVAGSL